MNTQMPPEHTRAEIAERQLIGDVLRDPDIAIDIALQHIEGPGDFYVHKHGLVFDVCRHLYTTAKAGGPYDVYQELLIRGQAADCGNVEWLVDAWQNTPTAMNVDHHADEVRQASLRRRAWHLAQRLLMAAEQPPTGSADEAIATAVAEYQNLLDTAAGRSTSVVPLDALLAETLSEVETRIASPAGRVGLSSGFLGLDGLLGGFRPGQLIVFGARPGVGKTAAVLAILTAVSGAEHPTFLASLEMPRIEIGERLLAMGTGVKLNRIRSGRGIDAIDLQRLAGANGPSGYRGYQMFVDDTSKVTAAKFGATVRTLVRRKGVKLAAVDYLQLFQPADRRDNRVQQVGKDARELKMAARECDIPILAPCQLNRAVEARANEAPRLSDLRESGEIEQHADVVVMLHVPPGQDEDTDLLTVEAHVQKNRSGPKGKVTLRYRGSIVRFENAAA